MTRCYFFAQLLPRDFDPGPRSATTVLETKRSRSSRFLRSVSRANVKVLPAWRTSRENENEKFPREQLASSTVDSRWHTGHAHLFSHDLFKTTRSNLRSLVPSRCKRSIKVCRSTLAYKLSPYVTKDSVSCLSSQLLRLTPQESK